jgi:hypothetical protein
MTDFDELFRSVDGPALPKHQDIIDSLVKSILGKNPLSPKEIKALRVTHFAGTSHTYLVIETGMPNDAGTAASIFCRDHRHIRIGKRGGLTLCNPSRKSNNWGRHNCVWEPTK